MPLWILWLLVPAAPAVFAYGLEWISWAAAGRPERFLPGSQALMLRALLVSLPFFTLAMVATYARKVATAASAAAWRRAVLVGLALNLLLWTAYHATMSSGAGGRASGFALALGAIALLSPAWIGYAMYREASRARCAAGTP